MLVKRNGLFAVAAIGVLSFVVYATTTNARPPAGPGGHASTDAGHDHAGHDHTNQTESQRSRSGAAVMDAPNGGSPPVPTRNSVEQIPPGPPREDRRAPKSPSQQVIPNNEQFWQPSRSYAEGNWPLADGTCSIQPMYGLRNHLAQVPPTGQANHCPLDGHHARSRTPYRDLAPYATDRSPEFGHSGRYSHEHDHAPRYAAHRHSNDCQLESDCSHSEHYGH